MAAKINSKSVPWSTLKSFKTSDKAPDGSFSHFSYLQEVGVPRGDVVSALLLVLVIISAGRDRVVLVVRAELNDLSQDGRVDVRQRNDLIFRVGLVNAQVFEHGSFDEGRRKILYLRSKETFKLNLKLAKWLSNKLTDCAAAFSHRNIGFEDFVVGGLELDALHVVDFEFLWRKVEQMLLNSDSLTQRIFSSELMKFFCSRKSKS